MKLIVGLGNPGNQYKDTRHNIGYMVVDKLAKELGDHPPLWHEDRDREAVTCKIGEVLLAKPTTFMNASGEAVEKLRAFFKIQPEDVWVIHDDLDLPIGKLRIREQGASAGHNGVDSIIRQLKTDKFVRFRLGVGRGKEDTTKDTDVHMRRRNVVSFVLSRFTQHEAGDLRKMVKKGVEAVRISLLEGLDKAMNRFN